MIYYKKKSWIKKIFNKIFKKREIRVNSLFLFLRNFGVVSVFSFVLLFVGYLFLLPQIITEQKVEDVLNNYLNKNSRLILDVDDLKVSPSYKFDINLKAKSAKLKYNSNDDFLILDNVDVDVNLLTLLFGYLDLNRIKFNKVVLNTSFEKNKYSCFDYISPELFDFNNIFANLELRKFKIVANEFFLNINDKNVNKIFLINANKIKIEKSIQPFSSVLPFQISSKGVILADNKRILDFNLDLLLKLKNNEFFKYEKIVYQLNYNPFLYAGMYDFSSHADVKLKLNPSDDKNAIEGKIDLTNLTFTVNGLKMPKNHLCLIFENNKLISDFDFNFFKNQYVKVKTKANINKNKFIEIDLASNELNLKELNFVILNFARIINLKVDFSDLNMNGLLIADLHLKSNFKTINSNGRLNIKNATLSSKKLGFSLNKINADVSLAENKIDFKHANAYFDNSKFNLSGTIDNKLNMNLLVDSELINMSQVINMLKIIPFAPKFFNFKDFAFKSGYLKINAKIKGNFKNPIIETNSYLKNLDFNIISRGIHVLISEVILIPNLKNSTFNGLNVELKNLKANYQKYPLSVSNLKCLLLKEKIVIPPFEGSFDNLKFKSSGEMRKINTQYPEIDIKLNAKLNKKNDFVVIKNQNLDLDSNIKILNNYILLKNCNLLNNSVLVAQIDGAILNYASKNPVLSKMKVQINDKLSLIFPVLDNLSVEVLSNLELNGKIDALNVNGVLQLFNLSYPKMGLYIKDAILNLKNSNCYLNISQGNLFDFKFDIISNAKFQNNKLVVDYAQVVSPYVDVNKIEKYLKNQQNFLIDFIEIKSMQGNIQTLEAIDFLLSSVQFEGDYKNNILNIKSFSANALNGKISGNSNINILTQKTKVDLILKEINARLLSSKFKDLSIAASGKISALISAEFCGFEFNEFMKSLDGYVKFNINDGELAQFAKLERFLQAGNILSQSILKLTINSTISAISKQNTGDFKTIEGTVKIKDSWANIQYIKTQGTNMSLYLNGRFNLLTQIADLNVLGRIPSAMVSVLGGVGKFSTESLLNKMSEESRDIVKSLTVSPIEKMMSIEIPQNDIEKIPSLVNQSSDMQTREFIVKIQGDINNSNSIRYFKWKKRED